MTVEDAPTMHARPVWPIYAALFLTFAIWCAVDVQRRARIDPEDIGAHRTDLTVYTEAGAAFFDGRAPYEVTNPRGWHYLYPPLFALLVAPLATLDPRVQACIWFAVSAAALLGAWHECRRIWRFVDDPPRLPSAWLARGRPTIRLGIVAGASLAVLLPTLNCMQRGQVGIVIVYLLLVGFRLVMTAKSRLAWLAGGATLALPVCIKLTPLLPVAFVGLQLLVAALWKREPLAGRRAGIGIAGMAAGIAVWLLLLPAALVGWNANLEHLDTWRARVVQNPSVGEENDFNVRSVRNQSLANAVFRFGNFAAAMFGGPDDQTSDLPVTRQSATPMDARVWDDWGVGLVRLTLLGLLATCGVWMGVNDLAGRAAAFGLAAAMTLSVSPLSWGHHYVILLPAVVFVPLWLARNGRFGAAWAFSASIAALSVAHYVAVEQAGRVGLLGIGAALWTLAACLLVPWVRRKSSPQTPATTPRPHFTERQSAAAHQAAGS